ncbi:MAG: hypothetical protein QNI87_11360 [Erythrobacter sp.]|uniref:DUF6959 family protein n=1 Tax=Erythrobacter sp. TaxID=1042 RepID=UPI0026163369|nr:hypothetical protein [Erythrobacter sp.]MDJ0979115.1 hypothetical protein [Erythrobacter sp.]
MNNIKRLGGYTNAVLVQLPERQQPGIVIQYDNLNNISSLLNSISVHLEAGDFEEVKGTLEEVQDIITGFKKAFKNLDGLQ